MWVERGKGEWVEGKRGKGKWGKGKQGEDGGKSKRTVNNEDSLFYHHHPNFHDFFPRATAPLTGHDLAHFCLFHACHLSLTWIKMRWERRMFFCHRRYTSKENASIFRQIYPIQIKKWPRFRLDLLGEKVKGNARGQMGEFEGDRNRMR